MRMRLGTKTGEERRGGTKETTRSARSSAWRWWRRIQPPGGAPAMDLAGSGVKEWGRALRVDEEGEGGEGVAALLGEGRSPALSHRGRARR